ncbi:MAG: hypothetical protein IK121_00080, partial [Lachnospiraceae bacterium]|nr:hypothetical protein [Lachnospiraceae bacterium]
DTAFHPYQAKTTRSFLVYLNPFPLITLFPYIKILSRIYITNTEYYHYFDKTCNFVHKKTDRFYSARLAFND